MDRSQPPGKISPLIKGARWSFLIVGFLYGKARYSTLKKKEDAARAIRKKQEDEKMEKKRLEDNQAKENIDDFFKNL